MKQAHQEQSITEFESLQESINELSQVLDRLLKRSAALEAALREVLDSYGKYSQGEMAYDVASFVDFRQLEKWNKALSSPAQTQGDAA